jgi:hypothetical protein
MRPPVFLLLVTDVGADGLFVSPDRVHEISSSPKMLPHKTAFAFAIDPRQMDRALILMKPAACDTAYFGAIDSSM